MVLDIKKEPTNKKFQKNYLFTYNTKISVSILYISKTFQNILDDNTISIYFLLFVFCINNTLYYQKGKLPVLFPLKTLTGCYKDSIFQVRPQWRNLPWRLGRLLSSQEPSCSCRGAESSSRQPCQAAHNSPGPRDSMSSCGF